MTVYKDIGTATKAMTATSGTVSLGSCRQAFVQAKLDTNSGYHIALKGSDSATATASKVNCHGIITNLGVQELVFGPGTHYVAYRVYNGATGITGGAADLLVVQKRG